MEQPRKQLPPNCYGLFYEAYTIPNQKASVVADTLVPNFMHHLGIPQEVHSDQGRPVY
jgi:hypothetical protein